MHLQEPTFEQFIERGVDARLARILTDPESYHRSLSIMVRAVYRGWDYYIPAGVTEIVPLWDESADCRVRSVRNGQTEHVWLYHDDPHWELIAKSEQGIMAQLWTEWIEFQDASDDECRRFAEAIGFQYWQKALTLHDTSYDRFQEWMRELRA